MKRLSMLGCGLFATEAWAFSAAPPQQPVIAPTSLSSLFQVALSLFAVLAFFWGIAWVFKRINQTGIKGMQGIKIVSTSFVGPKERVVIVEVDKNWLMLGVTPYQISLIKTWEKSPLPALTDSAASAETFAERLQKIVSRRPKT